MNWLRDHLGNIAARMTLQDRLKLKSIPHRDDWAYGESQAPRLPTTAELIKKYNKRLNIPPGCKISLMVPRHSVEIKRYS